jgi:hypothetical protein
VFVKCYWQIEKQNLLQCFDQQHSIPHSSAQSGQASEQGLRIDRKQIAGLVQLEVVYCLLKEAGKQD